MKNKSFVFLVIFIVFFVGGVFSFPFILNSLSSSLGINSYLYPKKADGWVNFVSTGNDIFSQEASPRLTQENTISATDQPERDQSVALPADENNPKEAKEPSLADQKAQEPPLQGGFGGRGSYEKMREAYSREII